MKGVKPSVVVKCLSKLNGWQRIYAVLLFFIYIPLCLLSVCDISVEKIDISKVLESSKELEKAWKNSEIDFKEKSSFLELLYEAKRRGIQISEENERRLKEHEKWIEEEKELKWIPIYPYKVIVGDHNYEFSINGNIKDSANHYERIYRKALEREYKKLLYREIIILISQQIFAAFVFYGFFYSIGWIYKGFKK